MLIRRLMLSNRKLDMTRDGAVTRDGMTLTLSFLQLVTKFSVVSHWLSAGLWGQIQG